MLAVEETDSVALGGALIAALLAPSVVLAPLAGVALDRSRAPRVLVFGGALGTAVALAIAGLLGILPTWVVVISLLVAGCCTPAFSGGLSSFAADVVPGHERAFASDTLSYNIAGVAGPGLAALAMAAGSGRLALELLAVIAAAGAVGVLLLKLPARPVPDEPSSVVGDVGRGMRHLVSHRPLALSTLSGTLTQLGGGALPIAAVALASERARTVADAGWIMTAFSIGGLVSALVSAWRPVRRWAPHTVMLGSFAATGGFTVVSAFAPNYTLTLIAMGLAGLFTAPGVAAMLTIRQRESPPTVRSQVFTVGAGLRGSAAAAGAAIAGGLGLIGAVPLTVLVGAVWIASAAILLLPRGISEAYE